MPKEEKNPPILLVYINIIANLSKDLQAMSKLILQKLDPRSQVPAQGQEFLSFVSRSNPHPHYNLIHRLHSLVLIAIRLELPTGYDFHSLVSHGTFVILRQWILAKKCRIPIRHIRVEGTEPDGQNADIEWCYLFSQDSRHTYIFRQLSRTASNSNQSLG